VIADLSEESAVFIFFLKMEEGSFSDMFVNIYRTTWNHIPQNKIGGGWIPGKEKKFFSCTQRPYLPEVFLMGKVAGE
jgi:hypothetical protein